MEQFTVLFSEHDEPKNVLTSHVEAENPQQAFLAAAKYYFDDVYEGWGNSFTIEDYALVAVFSGHLEDLR